MTVDRVKEIVSERIEAWSAIENSTIGLYYSVCLNRHSVARKILREIKDNKEINVDDVKENIYNIRKHNEALKNACEIKNGKNYYYIEIHSKCVECNAILDLINKEEEE